MREGITTFKGLHVHVGSEMYFWLMVYGWTHPWNFNPVIQLADGSKVRLLNDGAPVDFGHGGSTAGCDALNYKYKFVETGAKVNFVAKL